MAEHQGPRRRAACQIVVGGQNVTAKLNPYLISVQVIDTFEGGMDKCNLELDDRNAELQIPPDGVGIAVLLGWAGEGPRLFGQRAHLTEEELATELKFGGPGMRLVFMGFVTSVESGFTRRGGGRRLWIEAEAVNTKGPGKQIQSQSYGEGKEDDSQPEQTPTSGGGADGGAGKIPLIKVMMDMAGKAGMTAKLSPQMMKITRDFWHVNESPHHFGQRMAKELGGMFKVSNNTMILVGAHEKVNVDGVDMPVVDAVWGVNLIGWRIKPFSGRTQYSESASKYFDLNNATHEILKTAVSAAGRPFGKANAVAHLINSVPGYDVADQSNAGTASDSETSRGTGWALINGEPQCKAGALLHIIDARPGVDGIYLMTEVEHNYTRGVGYQTRCNVRDPVPDYSSKYPDYPREEKTEPKPPTLVPAAPETPATDQEIHSGITFPEDKPAETPAAPAELPPSDGNQVDA
jgi:phage protein D